MSAPPLNPITIVGGGIAGLATGYFLRQQGLEVRILEKEAQVGGKLRSSHRDGYTVDWGANGVLNNAPNTLELIEALGLSTQLQQASEVAKYRYIFWDGALRVLPLSPVSLLTTPLLLPSEKIRALLELFQRPEATNHEGSVQDESVYNFLKRHFGRGVAERFAEVMVQGISAGDPRQLSVTALFPRLKALEREHGSVLRGMIRAQRSGAVSRPRLSSFAGGTQVLIDALREKLAATIRTQAQVETVHYDGSYRLRLSDGELIETQQLVLATPAFVTAKLLAGLAPEATTLLNAIPYADVHVLGLGYDRIDVPHLLQGFCFLTPRGEGLRSLGVLYGSSIFPDQVPEGKVLLRVIAGGVPDPDFTILSEAEVLAVVRRDLRISLGITAEPELVQHIPWKRGIPQYTLGHLARLNQLDQALDAFTGLHLTGNAYRGVAVNDCIREAKALALRLAQDYETA
jgi:oxygen-dependent protoporphyrinogen oxidase